MVASRNLPGLAFDVVVSLVIANVAAVFADIAMQISFDSVAQLEGDDAITTEIVNSYNFVYVALFANTPGGEALLDPNVRLAIRQAIDYNGLLDTVVGGNGRLQASPIPNGFPGSDGLPPPNRTSKALERCWRKPVSTA